MSKNVKKTGKNLKIKLITGKKPTQISKTVKNIKKKGKKASKTS